MAGSDLPLRERLTSVSAWSDVAHNFRGDWQMLWKEIIAGFLLAGLIGLLGNDVFNTLFVTDAPSAVTAVENVIVGPIIAILSFVCSVGNVPLAAVLWSGGISFGGVIAFIFADLIILPIISAYRKYYGWSFALRITALMFVTMATAALLIDTMFSATGLVPTTRPTRDQVFGEIALDYKLALNLIALAVFAGLFALTIRRGATDPVCHMTVDRSKALTVDYAGHTYYFCSEGCRASLQADPDRYTDTGGAALRGVGATDQRKAGTSAGLATGSVAAAEDDMPMTPEIRGSPSDRTLPRMIVVEVLVTDNCPHEDDAISLVTMAAQGTGVTPRLTLIEIHDLEQAEQQQFPGSPTIRINGSDIAPPARHQAASLSCRVYHTTHGPSGVPELDLVRTALENARTNESR
jgi:YHS domain-containing protein